MVLTIEASRLFGFILKPRFEEFQMSCLKTSHVSDLCPETVPAFQNYVMPGSCLVSNYFYHLRINCGLFSLGDQQLGMSGIFQWDQAGGNSIGTISPKEKTSLWENVELNGVTYFWKESLWGMKFGRHVTGLLFLGSLSNGMRQQVTSERRQHKFHKRRR